MLSAAAAALLAGAPAARADTEISNSTSTALKTSDSGNITIDATGGVGVQSSTNPAITINSNNAVVNNGFISNTGVDSAVGVLVDTTAGNIVPPAAGFASTGTMDLGGGGTGKKGIWITGGNTFYGPITMTGLSSTVAGTTALSQASSIILKGDNSAAFYLQQGTKVTSNIAFTGGGVIYNSSDGSTASNSVMALLDGTLNGNFVNTSAFSGTGAGLIGIETLGGIHSCASDTSAPAGFTCPANSTGAFVNAGSISLIGTSFPSSRGGNPEAGSAVIIGGSIDGGFINAGPGTSSNVSAAVLTSAGLIGSGVVQPVLLIDPSRSITDTLTAPRGPAILGPMDAALDPIDPGYAFINRGTIHAQPLDSQISSGSVVIQGNSSTYFTCLSASAGTCSGLASNPQNNTGGMLNTGTISAVASTNTATNVNGVISASALYFGAFATVPRLDVKAETITGTTTTPGTITAQVSGLGQGSAFAVSIDANANVPAINVGKGASIVATVQTNTIAPNKSEAPSSAPFSLVSEAIVDRSGTLVLVNNAGTIQAANTKLNPAADASVVSIERAIDLSATNTANVTINNSGRILGDVLFGSAGNGDTLNVGNTASGGTAANTGTGVVNTPANYAVIAASILSERSGTTPLTDAALINFGSGTGHTLHVGGYGYVNADIRAGVGALDVQVDSNGLLYVANATTSLQARHFNVATNGTLGLSISQANLNSLTPVVQATDANLSGANLALQFGTFISSSNPTNPGTQSITLIRAPVIADTTILEQNALLGQNTPFLFETPTESGVTPLVIAIDASGQQVLQLNLKPRSVNATNADGSAGLNLSGDAKKQFPLIANALATDNELGAAVASSMTVYNNPGVASSGINIPASQQQAEQVFSQFAPDVSGGTRDIAIMLTDQATGPVAARQRLLRHYSDVPGEMTLWGEEFAGHINNKGKVSDSGTFTSYKDHGFGFTLGVDAGGPRSGWYGGAFTFYTGDVSQLLPRATKTNTQWYMLTGYTEWKGKHVFLDTQLSAAYGQFDETRTITVGSLVRTANSKRPGAMLAGGVNGGVLLKYLGIEVDPHVSLDGLTLREEGYTEANGGSGFNLQVAPYFANSLRTAIGTDLKTGFSAFGIDFSPEGRIGYRYDLLHEAVKIKAAFASTGGLGTTGNTMTFVGPDPDSGNVFAGLSFGAGTDTWHLGFNYDWVRGNNGSTTQVGTITVLGRI